MLRKPRGKCEGCGVELKKTRTKYCSNKCQQASTVDGLAEAWLRGETTGLTTNGTVTRYVKTWLLRTRGEKCEQCGWSHRNPHTGGIPLVADHIDGRWQNNRPENLRLLCPNCDSLTSTYKGANRGNGRPGRKAVE